MNSNLPQVSTVKQIVSEIDGSMVPVVEFDTASNIGDLRKTRKVKWREARLCFSREVESVSPIFRATMGSAEEAGDYWYETARAVGLGEHTEVHSVGDGASWIKDQADRIFGNQSTYLVDFFHLSEYLAEVAKETKLSDPKTWLKTQQTRLKEGQLYLVLQTLEDILFSGGETKIEATQACYRYMTNRLFQLDYLEAIQRDLPIGSGEIESSHRRVIQKRLKKPGGWWKTDNAESMLQLLTLRANGLWDRYWKASREFECKAA